MTAKVAPEPQPRSSTYWNAPWKGRIGTHERVRGVVREDQQSKLALDFDLDFEVDDVDEGRWTRVARCRWDEETGSLILEVFTRGGDAPIIEELATGLSSAQAGYEVLMDDVFTEGTWSDWRKRYDPRKGSE